MDLITLDVTTDGKYKINAIKNIEALKTKQESLQRQFQHLEPHLTQLDQWLQQQREEQEGKERSDSIRCSSLQSIMGKFGEDDFRWSKSRQGQKSRNHTLSEATEKVSSRVTKLEIKYATAIRDIEKKIRQMDHIVADNFKVLANYTEAISIYYNEVEEESKWMEDAIFALQEQVKKGLCTCKARINDLEHQLAKLKSAYSSYPSITKRRAALQPKSKDTTNKQPDIAKEIEFFKSTSIGVNG
ncbi:hypothetical protein MAM1_0073d04249 [Mucor ambiguus]|uniref:Uncharacterized protein n=1 Tax=Mucor ambiguus TaxID=91626 RepID=A0A0C9MBY3_9FUNG|nr:hypothetical protein MAM1_0073d04249 [Mucor ambiguus]